jgi:hypothetical protein
VTVVVICLVFGFMTYFFTQGCNGRKYNLNSDNYDHYYYYIFNPQKMFLATFFAALCLVFFAVSINLVMTLKDRAPKLYCEFKIILWSACFVLTIPLSFRAILDFLYQFNLPFQNYFNFDDHRMLSYNVAFVILTSYIPIFF